MKKRRKGRRKGERKTGRKEKKRKKPRANHRVFPQEERQFGVMRKAKTPQAIARKNRYNFSSRNSWRGLAGYKPNWYP